MKVYQVGGSVRDRLLGVSPRDRDYLVLGSSEEELLGRGLVKVGESFPVFLDRETGDEFTLGKSLEEDLGRRDLTINAMAIDEDGKLIDLFGGQEDLRKKILRAVNPENFFTDPLRVYRAARFLSQLEGFRLDEETSFLLKRVSETEAFRNVLPERIIKELRSVFATGRPSLFFGQTHEYLHELRGKWSLSVDRPGEEKVRFGFLTEKLSVNELDSFCRWLRIQNDWREFARAWILLPEIFTASDLLEYFYDIDAFRNPGLVEEIARQSGKAELLEKFALVRGVGISDVHPALKGREIADAIRRKRLEVLSGRS